MYCEVQSDLAKTNGEDSLDNDVSLPQSDENGEQL